MMKKKKLVSGKAPALLDNIRLGNRCYFGTNALAYLWEVSMSIVILDTTAVVNQYFLGQFYMHLIVIKLQVN